MSRTVYVLGTDHRFQMRSTDFTDAEHHRFAAFVLAAVQAHEISVLAEENNTQALTEAGLTESTIQSIARELKLPHCHCDPDRQTRAQLEIHQENEIRVSAFFEKISEPAIVQKIEGSMRTRERYWLAQLVELDTWPALFICGANHSMPFAELLRKNNVHAILVAQDWGT